MEGSLYYMKARFYDPVLGRFLSADSIDPDYGYAQSMNRYSYVLNNPLRYTDPTGHRVDFQHPGTLENPSSCDSLGPAHPACDTIGLSPALPEPVVTVIPPPPAPPRGTPAPPEIPTVLGITTEEVLYRQCVADASSGLCHILGFGDGPLFDDCTKAATQIFVGTAESFPLLGGLAAFGASKGPIVARAAVGLATSASIAGVESLVWGAEQIFLAGPMDFAEGIAGFRQYCSLE